MIINGAPENKKSNFCGSKDVVSQKVVSIQKIEEGQADTKTSFKKGQTLGESRIRDKEENSIFQEAPNIISDDHNEVKKGNENEDFPENEEEKVKTGMAFTIDDKNEKDLMHSPKQEKDHQHIDTKLYLQYTNVSLQPIVEDNNPLNEDSRSVDENYDSDQSSRLIINQKTQNLFKLNNLDISSKIVSINMPSVEVADPFFKKFNQQYIETYNIKPKVKKTRFKTTNKNILTGDYYSRKIEEDNWSCDSQDQEIIRSNQLSENLEDQQYVKHDLKSIAPDVKQHLIFINQTNLKKEIDDLLVSKILIDSPMNQYEADENAYTVFVPGQCDKEQSESSIHFSSMNSIDHSSQIQIKDSILFSKRLGHTEMNIQEMESILFSSKFANTSINNNKTKQAHNLMG